MIIELLYFAKIITLKRNPILTTNITFLLLITYYFKFSILINNLPWDDQ